MAKSLFTEKHLRALETLAHHLEDVVRVQGLTEGDPLHVARIFAYWLKEQNPQSRPEVFVRRVHERMQREARLVASLKERTLDPRDTSKRAEKECVGDELSPMRATPSAGLAEHEGERVDPPTSETPVGPSDTNCP